MSFTEDARVKIPAILHLTRLGFDYLPLTPESTRFINALVLLEYLDEFNGQHPA